MMSSDNGSADQNGAGWEEAVDRLEAANSSVLAFLPELDVSDRLGSDVPADGPLHALPVGVKDLYRVDGLATTAGSVLPPELFEGEQSWIVSLLRAAGAVVLGKTAMDEFAYCEPPPTRNPRDLTRTPDGSSGGSAAAVAAGMCPLALGSQTLHSTIGPAAYCGVVGYKASFGRWPFDGVFAAPSFDTLGFLAADVATVTRAARLLPGWKPDATTKPILGVPDAWGVRRLHAEGWTAYGRHVDALRDAGFEIRTSPVPWNDDVAGSSSVIGDLVNAEFAAVHRDWFDGYRQLYRRYTADAIERGRAIQGDRVAECLDRRRSFIDALDRATQDLGIDCWICPSAGSVATPFEGAIRDTWMTRFWSFAGWPAVSIPIFDGPAGLPHGAQIVAPHGRDERLLQWAAAIEAALAGNA